jgi:hypothetical protein
MKKPIVIVILSILLVLPVTPTFGQQISNPHAIGNPTKDAQLAEKVKASISKLGTGEDAKVKVKLNDGTKLRGYVSGVYQNHFFVTSDKDETTEVSYQEIKQVKGNNLSTGAKVAIGFAILILIFTLPVALSKDGI